MEPAYTHAEIQKILDWDRAHSSPRAPVPEYIQLPDGRAIETRSLYARISKSQIIKLKPIEDPNPRRKYTDADRVKIAHSTPEEISAKYNLSIRDANTLKTRVVKRIREINIVRKKYGLSEIPL